MQYHFHIRLSLTLFLLYTNQNLSSLTVMKFIVILDLFIFFKKRVTSTHLNNFFS